MLELAISLLGLSVALAIAEWRLGLLLCIVTAILQDPLRKLTPGQPIFYVVFVGVVFAGMCLGALARGVPLSPNMIFKRYRHFVTAFSLFLALIIMEACNSYVRFENPVMTGLGLLTYVLPLVSIVCAYQLVYRQGELRISQFLKWYVVCTALALTTVYLEFSGYNWSVLGTVGTRLWIYETGLDRPLNTYAGLFRAPEIAAWHAMTAACFIILLILSRRISFTRVLGALAVAALLLALGLLTGRRKIIIEFAVFICSYAILWGIFARSVSKIVMIAVAGVAVIGFFWLVTGLREDNGPKVYDQEYLRFSHYVSHSEAVFEMVPKRFVDLGIAPVEWAYEDFGLFGAGLGTGTQGTQNFGGGISGASEGGLGKITLELGVPGLFVMGWIAILIFRSIWKNMGVASRHSRRLALLSFGFFSFLVANVAGFSVATQAYGDIFILLILSWIVAFLLAIPILVEREVRARQLASVERPSPVFRPRTV
jgi:hypothetical protein